MDAIWLNPYVETAGYFAVAVVALIVFLAIFEIVTKYNDWDEIMKGNIAVALATGGKIFALGNIFRFAIYDNETMWEALVWSAFGFVLLLIAYFIFEFMTPRFKVDEEIKNDNRAVGLISMFISIALSFVIGASIS